MSLITAGHASASTQMCMVGSGGVRPRFFLVLLYGGLTPNFDPEFSGGLTPNLFEVPAAPRHRDHLGVGEAVDLRRHARRVEHERERPVAAFAIGSVERRYADHAHVLAALAALHQGAHAREELAAGHGLATGPCAFLVERKNVVGGRC